ncbi:MAG: methyltransferase domain-containing protein, partial [Chloroflexi bacterium]|nr:methyltransferase domain-containing protein [Chloroflexota bacterium]
MHRIQGTDPWRDTMAKVRAARPRGRVLDTCMGLGYTAIAAAREAEWVLTVELDPAVIALARENPWSEPLFTSPRIQVVQGDVAELIAALPDEHFSVIVHDPPMFSLAGELYGLAFYREMHRVLRPRGRVFHYVGNPEGKMARNVTRSVTRRLHEAGFHRVHPARQAFGLIARK